MKVAYLASAVTLPGSPSRRADAHEHDLEVAALLGPFSARGLALEEAGWDDPDIDWSTYGAAIIRTTWDYCDRPEEFLSALQRIESQTHLFNPVTLVAWNGRKTYLRDMAARGAKTVPTLWLEHPEVMSLAAAFDELGSDDIVIKRQVGAGAEGQVRLRRGDPAPDFTAPMMAQPFLSAVQSEGEYSFVFIDGDLSHALIKRAAPGDYRIQSIYGGVEEAITPDATDVASADAVMAALNENPLYARVDMVRGDDGRLALMELELIEPYLYPLKGPELGERLATALLDRLG